MNLSEVHDNLPGLKNGHLALAVFTKHGEEVLEQEFTTPKRFSNLMRTTSRTQCFLDHPKSLYTGINGALQKFMLWTSLGKER